MDILCTAYVCPVILNSTCVFYEGDTLLYTGITANDSIQVALQKIDAKFAQSQIGYAFNNGVYQATTGAPVGLGGSLAANTSIGGNYTLTFVGNVQAAKHIVTGGNSFQFQKGDGTLDSTAYQTAGSYITALTGDVTASGPGSAAASLATVNSTPGTYGSASFIPVVTVDGKGRVTSLTTTAIAVPSGVLSFIGDVYGSGSTGSPTTLTLTDVNSNIYTSLSFLKIKVNSKGLVTGATPVTDLDINSVLGYTPLTNARTLSINGVTYDLSANRSWVSVSNVSAVAGTGIAVSVSNPTTTPEISITNTAPDRLVTISQGNNISVSGTYPNFTISNTAPTSNWYGAFSSTVTQAVTGANQATAITYNNAEITNQITYSGSRITVQNTGIYEIGYSLQIEVTSGGALVDVDIWLKKNGTSIIRTDSIIGLQSNSGKQLPYVSIIDSATANDYYEVFFASTSANTQITAVVANSIHPAAPSIITNIKQIGVFFGAPDVSGTINYLPKFTSTTSMGNSNIQDSGTLITLGSNTTISSGGLGIGTSSLSDTVFNILKTLTGTTTQYGIAANYTISSGVTANAILNNTYPNTQNATFTLGNLFHYKATQGVFGASSTVTNQYGFFVDSNLIGATNDYGFYGNIPSGTNMWNLYMAGAAKNYLAGSLLIGTVTDAGYKLDVVGTTRISGVTTLSNLAGTGSRVVVADASGVLSASNALSGYVTGSGTTNTVPKFTSANVIGNSNITDSGTSISLNSDTVINGLLSGTVTKVLPTGNTIAGFTYNITGSANGWNLLNRNTWNFNDDAFTFGGMSVYNNNIYINRSSTSSNGFVIYESTIYNNGTATQSLISYNTNSFGTGNYSSYIAYNIGSTGTVSNTNSYTSYFGFNMSQTPQNNVTNYYGINIADFTGSSLSRALNLNLSSGTNKYNIYAGGTASNYLSGSLVIGTTSLNASAKLQVDSTTQGFLPPRMTSTQRLAISSPAAGLIVFDTTTLKSYTYDGTTWNAHY